MDFRVSSLLYTLPISLQNALRSIFLEPSAMSLFYLASRYKTVSRSTGPIGRPRLFHQVSTSSLISGLPAVDTRDFSGFCRIRARESRTSARCSGTHSSRVAMHINVRCVGEAIGTPPQVLKPLVLSHQWPFSALGIPGLSLPGLLPIHS